MDKLIARLEAGTGPDRKLDRKIHALVFPDDIGTAPLYTSHLVPALTVFKDQSPRALCIAALKARKEKP